MTAAPPSACATGTSPWWRVDRWWYLAYLGLLGFQPAFDPDATARDWAVVAGTIAVFLPLYVLGQRQPGRVRRWCTAAIAALGLLVVGVNGGAAVLFVFAAGLAGSFEPREDAVRWLTALTVLLGAAAALTPLPLLHRIGAFAFPLLLVWIVGRETMKEVDREREALTLRADNARIEHLATVSERERIARDLHDLLGHSLSAVVVRAQLVQRLVAADPERAVAEAAAVERTAREALTEVRAAVGGWRHAALDEELAVAAEALSAAGVRLVVDRAPDLHLVPSVEQALTLALREAVTNVVRHAGARRCTIALARVDDEVQLRIADDGRGATAPEGNGLTGMRERVAAIGGRIERSAGAGTTLTIAVPAAVAA